MAFFDPVHGIGLDVDAGSGRSGVDEPGGDPRHAHCRIDFPGDALLPTPPATPDAGPGAGPRPVSNTLFVAWDELLRFADRLAGLGETATASGVALGDRFAMVQIDLRRDGRLRARTAFTLGHHVKITVRCQTLWNLHFATRDDLPALADQVRDAVHRTRPS